MIDLFSAAGKYCVDTCSLTEMRRRYSRDVFPGAWAKLDALASAKIIVSVEDVLEELEQEDDEILEWALRHSDIFLDLDEAIQQHARDILVRHPTLVDLKKKKSSADPFVIAAAKAYGYTVVTEEKPSGGPPKKKIPDVCKIEGVECITLLEMLRREGLRLG